MARIRRSSRRPLSLHIINSSMPRSLLLCLCYLALSSLAAARLVNITVDDTNPDPLTGATFTYAPPGRWTQGNGCAGCLAKLDTSKVHDGTWQDATYDSRYPEKAEVQTASLPFTGTAFYVYGVLSQSNDGKPDSNADISFFIDGQPAGNFKYTPPGIPNSYIYNYLLWHTDSLPLSQHTFSLQNGRPGGNLSLILFDYVVYTRDDGTSASTSVNSNSAGSTSSVPQSPSPSIPLSPSPGVSQSPSPGVSQSPPSSLSQSPSPNTSQSPPPNVSQPPPPSVSQSPPPDTADADKHAGTSKSRTIIIACVVSLGVVAIAAAAFVLYRRHKKRQVLQAQWDTHITPGEDGFEATPFVANETVGGQMQAVNPGPLPGSSANTLSAPWLTNEYLESLSHADVLIPALAGPGSQIDKDETDESPPAYDSLQRAPTSAR